MASKTPHRTTSKRRPSGAPPRQARRPRRLFKATTPHEPERLPSNWPVPCGAGGLDHACLFNLQRSRPAPCRLPRSAPAPSRDGWSLQTISSFTGLPRSLARARGSEGTHRTGRKMLLSDFCNRPHVTSTLTDDSILEFAPLETLRPRERLESFGGVNRFPDNPSGASLDGDPPASAAIATFAARPVAVKPRPSRGSGVVRSWRVLRSTAPPNDAARPRCYRPRAELVTLPLTLSVARRCRVDRGPPRAGCQDRLQRHLVKDGDFVDPERLPSTSAPLREPATVLTTLPSRAGFRRSFAPRFQRSPFGAEGLDPTRFRAGQAPLVDFCNQNNPRARAADHPIPGRVRRLPSRMGPGGPRLGRHGSRDP